MKRSRKRSFSGRVLEVVGKIHCGRTMTYAEVAHRAGHPRAARAVGNILNKNYDPSIPCHWVIKSDGSTGGYNRGATLKKAKLVKEGAIPESR